MYMSYNECSTEGNIAEKAIIFPIFYWGNSNVGWFQIFFAIYYLHLGASVTFVFDDAVTRRKRVAPNYLLMRIFIFIIRKHSKVRVLKPNFTDEKSTDFDEIIYRKHYCNTQWTQKKAVKLSDFNLPDKFLKGDRIIAKAIDDILKSQNYTFCFCPGGVYGNSFLWRHLCNKNNLRFSSFDSDPDTVILSPSGVAAHRADVVHRYKMGNDHDRLDREKIYTAVRENIFKRSQTKIAKKEDLLQRVSSQSFENNLVDQFFAHYSNSINSKDILQTVVIFLNTSWDSAALDLEPWRVTQVDWLDNLVPELIRNGAERILIRQHPDERFYPSNDNYEQIIQKYKQLKSKTSITLINEFSNQSSYDFLLNATCVFTFSSTIGLEANILNRPTFAFKRNYQTMLNALPYYQPGKLTEMLRQHSKNVKNYKDRSFEVYFLSQLKGWERISLENFADSLQDRNCHNRMIKLAENILNAESE